MRFAAPLSLAAVVCCATDLGAAPPLHPEPAPAPLAPEGTTGEGVVVLRTPPSERVLLRAGTFTMGSDGIAEALKLCRCERSRDDIERGSDDCDGSHALITCKDDWFAAELPAHQVYLSDYWLDRREVTVARYRACVAAGVCTPPPYAEGGERFDQPTYPVVLVTWNDARRFCAWAGGRLPTEAEWERAARGLARKESGATRPAADEDHPPQGRVFPWGNVYNPFLANHGSFSGLDELDHLDARDGFLELAPVGSFPEGRTPEGIEDLAGNVQEWVSDWYAPGYPKADEVNPKGPEMGDRRVVRGGSYLHGPAWLRGAARDNESPSERLSWVGFRCARDG